MADYKKFWDTWASEYDILHFSERNSYSKIAENIHLELKDGSNVLEVACGTGLLSEEILKRSRVKINYIATDFSEKNDFFSRKKN